MSKVYIKSFNQKGVNRAHEFLDAIGKDPASEPDLSILDDRSLIGQTFGIEIDRDKEFATRLDFACYIHQNLNDCDVSSPERDKGIWVWLALLYFYQLCPANSKGLRKPGERARWIPDLTSWKRYYRHLVVGPYRIYSAHKGNPDLLVAILANDPSKSGDLYEQIASRQQLITNKNVVETINRLYFDFELGKLKRGAGGKDRGGARRLADTLNQFDLTYDLYSVNAENLIAMLPSEFNRFKN